MGNKKNEFGCTKLEEDFAHKYVELGVGSRSYFESYNCSRDISTASLASRAHEVLKRDHVAKRIETLRAELRDISMVTKAQLIDALMEIVLDNKLIREKILSIEITDTDLRKKQSLSRLKSEIASTGDAVGAIKQISKMLDYEKPGELGSTTNIQVNILPPAPTNENGS